ncbi:hypothetical protein JXO59_14590 [candidate division KSB1 bacterium]|nr:hypothetical protein [candidate division KSB1 bacterium]
MKRIWIDMDDLPHVQIFQYMTEALRRHARILITAREPAYICERLQDSNPVYKSELFLLLYLLDCMVV